MILTQLDMEAGTITLTLDSADCELLARTFNEAIQHDDAEHNQWEDMALMFTFAGLATRIYGTTNADARMRDSFQRYIERCDEPLRSKYDPEEGGE